ncbi:MAG: NUDIX domain-containing protein [Patescibacteria group bacterium]
MTESNKHEVVITAIVEKDGKYLITRRSANKKRFPGMWTVPGGKLEVSDYSGGPKDTKDYWYNVLEKTLAREVKEEVGLEIKDIDYLTSFATVHADGSPSIGISCLAKYVGGEVTLQTEEADAHAWVTTDEARGYSLLDGIIEELVQADNLRAGRRTEWRRE